MISQKKPLGKFSTDIGILKIVSDLFLLHSKSVKLYPRYFLIFNMNFKGKGNERQGSEVDVKARLIIALIDKKTLI